MSAGNISTNISRILKWGIPILFTGIYAAVSLVNHYLFRTYTLDLGLYNNAIFDYAHLRMNDSSFLPPLFDFRNQLSDHFDLMIILVSPLYYLFGSWTLLIVQIASITSGGIAVYIYFRERSTNEWLPLAAMFHFYSLWGIYSALSFDYHSNVVAAMMVPWMFLYFERGKYGKAAVFFALMLMCKENMALWAVFIGGALYVWKRYTRDTAAAKVAAIFTLCAAAYFILALRVFMPAFTVGNDKYIHFAFSSLGTGMGEALKTALTRPFYVFALLLGSESTQLPYPEVKRELHMMVLWSGGFAFLLRPRFLIMAIPIYCQKLLNDDPTKWGINGQYSIEFVPLITFALFSILLIIRNKWIQTSLAVAGCMVAMFVNLEKLKERDSFYYTPLQANFLDRAHYQRPFDVAAVHKQLNAIEDSVKVSVSASLGPHMAFHERSYQFPYIGDATTIALLTCGSVYPLYGEWFTKRVDSFDNSPYWRKVYDRNYLLIYSRR